LRRHDQDRLSVGIIRLLIDAGAAEGCRTNRTAFAGNFDGIFAIDAGTHFLHAERVAECTVAEDAVVDDPTGAVSVNAAFKLAGFRGIVGGGRAGRTALSLAQKWSIAFERRTSGAITDAAAVAGAGQARLAAPSLPVMIDFPALGKALFVVGIGVRRWAQPLDGALGAAAIRFHDWLLAENRRALFRFAHNHSAVTRALSAGAHLPLLTLDAEDTVGRVANGSIAQQRQRRRVPRAVVVTRGTTVALLDDRVRTFGHVAHDQRAHLLAILAKAAPASVEPRLPIGIRDALGRAAASVSFDPPVVVRARRFLIIVA